MSTEEFTPNCRCKKGEVRTYLRYENAIEGTLVVDHEPPTRSESPEQLSWKGGLAIERRWRHAEGAKETTDFVLLDFSEVERVRDACNAFLHDHTP